MPLQPAALELLSALSPVLARAVNIGGTTVPVVDPEDLVIAKIIAGRPKDVEDAQTLWRLHGQRLDANRIRRTLELLEEALGQSDLRPQFESLVQHGASSRQSPREDSGR